MKFIHKTNRNFRTILFFVFLLSFSLALASGCSEKDDKLPSVGGGGTIPATGNSTFTYGSYVQGTDKWHLSFDTASLNNCLEAAPGLSSADSTEIVNKTVSYIKQFYSGLAISFSTQPFTGGSVPANGVSTEAAIIGPGPYNKITFYNSGSTTATGRAIMDTSNTNKNVENDTWWIQNSTSPAKLGVFLDRFTNVFVNGQCETLDDYAYHIAAVCAHEIGHSLGLNHDDSTQNIMNSVSMIDPSTTYSFSSAHITFLNSKLPGPARD